jgi:deoxyribodipyrimidine photo-lyase
MKKSVSIFWFRRDLRLEDNSGLWHALTSDHPVVPVFIFDTNILNDLTDKYDRRVHFIHQALTHIQSKLASIGSSLHVLYGTPLNCFQTLLNTYDVQAVYANHDYEPYAAMRDNLIKDYLLHKNVSFNTFKDQVIFEKSEVMKDDGTPYTVFTPYSKKWKLLLQQYPPLLFDTISHYSNFLPQSPIPLPHLDEIGFNHTDIVFSPPELDVLIAKDYNLTRNFPGIKGTTRLSMHLRFGTISIRSLVTQVLPLNETLLNELIWRDFYHMILWHFPHVVNHAFKKEYDSIPWRDSTEDFERWCSGLTGYPIVDAGMRELNETGYMHNRVRMIVASFLTKHLLIDWRKGEAYFAQKLLDFDLAANNGGWQWAAGSGCDAAPYFRIFNPHLQTEKFDPKHTYIAHWVPDYQEFSYPPCMIEHDVARKRCLSVYKNVLDTKHDKYNLQ